MYEKKGSQVMGKDSSFMDNPSPNGPRTCDANFQYLYDSVFAILSLWYIILTIILCLTHA